MLFDVLGHYLLALVMNLSVFVRQEKGSVSFAVDYEFAARMKPNWEFMPKSKGSYVFTGGKAVGYRNLFGMQWQEFIAEDSPYFRDGIVHLRAELTIKKPPS